jgi:hypothetical protein
MSKIMKIWAVLLPFLVALVGCAGAAPTSNGPSHTSPAELVVITDTSLSVQTPGDGPYGKAELQRVGDVVDQMALGDTITVFEAGAKSADRAVAHPTIVTGYKLRMVTARAMTFRQLEEIGASYRQHGGDGATNLLFTLENAHVDCSSGRSKVILISDGVEDSDAYSASAALRAGKAVELPSPPPGRKLEGCSVTFLGFGVSKDGNGSAQILPARQLEALRQGWTAYLAAAGVKPGDIDFASII